MTVAPHTAPATGEGAAVAMAPCSSSEAQQFRFEPFGTEGHRLRIRHTLMCVDLVGLASTNNAQFEQQVCQDRASQRFKAVALPPGEHCRRAMPVGARHKRVCDTCK